MVWGYKRFYRRTLLETSDYLKDDCLKINCTVGVVVSAVDSPRLQHSIRVPELDIGSHFGMLLDNMEGSDVVFNVLVLAARSPVFRSEFFNQDGEKHHEIDLTDMEPKVFKIDKLMEDELVASSSFSESDSLIAKLLVAADKYDLVRLSRRCESHLCKDTTVGRALSLADRYHATELKT
ncbi:hypothetical protein R6Q59_006690 [Mikania micrantha]|uniref:MATH domain-containing protein n=1 Tax=Mikania micrantha TaxID=192012 RepID=A0A5N6PVG8_9ASTR|nr:hypothetical protein E3N88_03818 [Mikania micrantha]